MHPDPVPFARKRDGTIREFKKSTKKHLKRCPHCGQPVDVRYWAAHRARAHTPHRKGVTDES